MLKQFVVAIAAANGSLEALQKFFDNTPLNNASYIILRHLPVSYTSMLEEVLQQHSKLQVRQAIDRASIENDVVYYAPPYYQLTVDDGMLKFVIRTGKLNRSICSWNRSLKTKINEKLSPSSSPAEAKMGSVGQQQ